MGWKELIHNECGKVAMLCKDNEYHELEIACPEDFKHIDGKQYEHGDIAVCDSCGCKLHLYVEHDKLYVRSLL